MDNSISRTEDVVWRKIGDEIVVIKDDGLSVHVLNKTAALIWELCADTCTSDEIAAKICERFAVSPDEARGDVEVIVEQMGKIGLMKLCERMPH
ncbi:MAG: hypothetical protein A2144_02210 [Chloroflexi bacterium RBG_16_50_9]|nr:MAG: hypothetical protein A2144_02210 [Chloroflexi bacterium RBG_16_50_9]